MIVAKEGHALHLLLAGHVGIHINCYYTRNIFESKKIVPKVESIIHTIG